MKETFAKNEFGANKESLCYSKVTPNFVQAQL